MSVRGVLANVLLLTACQGALSRGATSDASTGVWDGGAPRPNPVVDGGATSDAPRTQPPTPAGCPSGSVFCESFEDSADLVPSRWERGGDGMGVSIDETVSRDGTRSLHVRTGAAYGIGGEQTAHLLTPISAPEDRIYVRWYMRFGDLRLPGYHPNLVNVVGPDYDIGNWPIYSTISFGTFLSEFSINGFGNGLDGAHLWYEDGANLNPTDDNGDMTPERESPGLLAGEWICVEWMVYGDHQGASDTDHAAEEERVWVNGAEVPALASNDERWAPWNPPEHWSPIYDGSLWTFGIAGAIPNGPTEDIWFDSIVFSNAPIGCD
jgi:hypothetical protein